MTADELIFRASLKGVPVTVGLATPTEIQALALPDGSGEPTVARDFLEFWSLIAIRSGSACDIHALGWRPLLANTWITSPLVAITEEGAVVTRSGKIYLLAERDDEDLKPELRAHLGYALRTWGFEEVREN